MNVPYPPISTNNPRVVVPILAGQVVEFVDNGMSLREATNTVVRNRYNGRFNRLSYAVARLSKTRLHNHQTTLRF